MQSLDTIAKRLQDAELALERERGVVQSLASKGQLALSKAQQAAQQAAWNEEAALLLNRFSDEKQAEVITTIQNIASLGLSQVFEEPIEMVITTQTRARRVEMDVKIKTGDLETSIMDARGGGLAAVAGFLLRACVLLLTPETRRIMVLDEVFAMVSEEYVPRIAEFLHELCAKTGLQVILVTHQPEFAEAADRVYRIVKTGPNTAEFVLEK